jgi:hypothetical protein
VSLIGTDQNQFNHYYVLSYVSIEGRKYGTFVSVNPIVQTMPEGFKLSQNYPNPFNPTTTIRYTLPQRAYVTLNVFNTLGQRVTTLVNENQEVGYHDVRFDAGGFASGVYLYQLRAGGYVASRMLVVRSSMDLMNPGALPVPKEGLEPSPPCRDRILSPARLPVPPLWRVRESLSISEFRSFTA